MLGLAKPTHVQDSFGTINETELSWSLMWWAVPFLSKYQ